MKSTVNQKFHFLSQQSPPECDNLRRLITSLKNRSNIALSKRFRRVAALSLMSAAVVAFFAGCGQSAIKLSSEEAKVFDQAPPEVKQAWEKAIAADKGTDYVNAQALLEAVGQMQLTEPQKAAWIKERESFSQRLWKAAEANDPAAVKAVQASRGSRSRPPAPQ